MTSRRAEHPPARHVLAHLSDSHFVPPSTPLLHGVADSRKHLTRLLGQLESSRLRPEALIFTGDLADKGEVAAYRSLRQVVVPTAARMGAEVIWVMGNHDDRSLVRTELVGAEASVAPYDHVVLLGGLRVVVLDTTVPGSHHGELDDAQLRWLADVLAEPAPDGTVLAMHHPPLPCLQDLAVKVELRDQAALASVLRGSDVRSILAGHLHYSTSATFAGIPVSVAAATCYTQDLMTPDRGTRGRDGGQSLNLVHVYDEVVMHSVVPMGGFPTVGSEPSIVALGTAGDAGADLAPSRARRLAGASTS